MSHYEPAGTKPETVLYTGASSGAGNANATTLIDANLIGKNDFFNDSVLFITSGVTINESRDIIAYDSVTGTLFVKPAFSAQIALGVSYEILNQKPLYRYILDTVFNDNFDDDSLSTTLWQAAVVTGSTTVTESGTPADVLNIANTGAGTTGSGTLSTIARFGRNTSIRSKIEVFTGAVATDGQRCRADIRLYSTASDYIYFGAYRDTSEAVNSRVYLTYKINGGVETSVSLDATILDNVAREFRMDIMEENIMFYVDNIILYTLQTTTLKNYFIQLYAETQNNTDVLNIRYDYMVVNRSSNDIKEIYKKLLQMQGGTDSIGTIVNTLEDALDLNYIRTSVTADGTEQTLYANTTSRAAIFVNLDLDLVNMALGDNTVLRVYKMVDGTTYRLQSVVPYNGAQTLTCVTISGNEGIVSGYKITLQQTAGTNRAYPYIYFDQAA